MDRRQLLRSVPIFATLSDDHLHVLAANSGIRICERGATIFHQGSPGDMLYIVISGQVRLYTISQTGQELSVLICGPGNFFGELALLDGQMRSATATTMRRSELLTLRRGDFRQAIRSFPEISLTVLETLSNRLRTTNGYMEYLVSHSAPQRVVRRLLDLADQHGIDEGNLTRINLRLTQDDLASLSGTTRETVNRVLSSLRDQGLIRVERAQVSVLNLALLEQMKVEV